VPLGDIGEWITDQIETTVPERAPLSILISDIPSRFVLEEPFQVTFKILNHSANTIKPRLSLITHPTKAIVPVGNLTWTTPPIPPYGSDSVRVCFLPLKLGLQQFCGINIQDLANPSIYKFQYTTNLFIEHPGTEEIHVIAEKEIQSPIVSQRSSRPEIPPLIEKNSVESPENPTGHVNFLTEYLSPRPDTVAFSTIPENVVDTSCDVLENIVAPQDVSGKITLLEPENLSEPENLAEKQEFINALSENIDLGEDKPNETEIQF